MIRLIVLVGALALAGCGFSATDSEMIGQVKKVMHNTPLICPEYMDVDLSMGVMRNGVGSMSSEDTWLVVTNSDHLKLLKEANESGQLVKIKYDTYRVTLCTSEKYVRDVQLVK